MTFREATDRSINTIDKTIGRTLQTTHVNEKNMAKMESGQWKLRKKLTIFNEQTTKIHK
jgi:hypothetical protein